MNNKDKVILYNLIFPVWFIVWMPEWWWLLLIPANFAVDYLVLKKCFEKRGIDNKKALLKKYTWKTFAFGLLSDFTQMIVVHLVISLFYGTIIKHNEQISAVLSDAGKYLIEIGKVQITKFFEWIGFSMHSLWNNPIPFIIIVIGVILAGFLMYVFNRDMLRKKCRYWRRKC